MAEINLTEKSLSQIIIEQMQGNLEAGQIEEAKGLVAERIEQGETELRALYFSFRNQFLRGKKVEIRPFHDYFSQLAFLYERCPHSVEQMENILEKEVEYKDPRKELSHRKAMIRACEDLFTKGRRIRNLGLKRGLQHKKSLIEIVCPKENGNDLPINLMIVRRKDTERAIEKIAYRLVKRMRRDTEPGYQPKRADIDDWFGIELVTSQPEQAEELAGTIYKGLADYGLRPDSREEEKKRKDGTLEEGRQQPGFDDHYQYGGGKDRLVQVKVVNHIFPVDIKEIYVTDYVNLLVDKMDHPRFDAFRTNETKSLSRDERRQQGLFVLRGNDLLSGLPEKRSRVLAPSEYF